MSFEQPLAGGIGNAGQVVRVGDTVRRPAGPQTPVVAAYLRHLEHAGFAGAPRFLGHDERGREVVSWVEGDVAAHDDVPAWAVTDEALVSVVTLARALRAASRGFTPPPDAEWAWPPAPGWEGDVMGHNDPCRENVVFRAGRAHAFIDFDWAAPVTEAWEMAGLVRHWVLALPGDRLRRLALAREAWPVEGLRAAMLARFDSGLARMRAKVEEGHPGFTQMWRDGVFERNAELRAWAAEHLGD